jgi:outer membrane immunogenic protein
MRRLTIIAAAAAFIGGTGFASAADLASFKDTPYSTPLAPVWAGMYIGGHLGGLSSDNGDVEAFRKRCDGEWVKANYIKIEDEKDDTTLIGGVHVGYNWQRSATVVGIEADVDFADGIDYLATLRGRLGYAAGNFLIYATAGVAVAAFDDEAIKYKFGKNGKSHSIGSDDDDAEVGFVVGGGVEYKIRPNWSVGVEGLYYAFDDSNNEYKFGRRDQYKITEESDNDFWVVRARLSYHFQSEAEAEPLK